MLIFRILKLIIRVFILEPLEDWRWVREQNKWERELHQRLDLVQEEMRKNEQAMDYYLDTLNARKATKH